MTMSAVWVQLEVKYIVLESLATIACVLALEM